MLRAATDQGLEELVQCIESFQQYSVECPTEQPQVFLLPDQLPWDNEPHPHADGAPLPANDHNDNGQVNDFDLNDMGVVEREQQEHHPNDRTNQTSDVQNRRNLLSSLVPQETVSVDHSSLYSGGSRSASLAARNHVVETRSPSPRSRLPHETGNQRLGAGGRVVVPSEDRESWNQFSDDDDDSGDESGSVVQVLHVDDPRLAFGQSVYVGRRDHSDGLSQAQSLRPPSQDDVVNVQGGQSTESGSGKPSFCQPLVENIAVAPVTSHSTALQHLDSSSQSQGYVSARTPSLLPPSAFAPTTGTTAQSTEATAPISSSFNLAQAVPPPSNSQQPPSSIQSLPISMSTGQSSQTLQSGLVSLGGSSDAAMSSLGFSPSGPPLRARATDLEGESVNSNPSSGLSDVNSFAQHALNIILSHKDVCG